jgi:hypothetical protein
VTRSGEVLPIERLFTFHSSVEHYRSGPTFGLFFQRKSFIFTKNGLGYILCVVFSNSSGHPADIASSSNAHVDFRLHGSRSYEFIDISACYLYPQLEVTTRGQARQQIILLQVLTLKPG